MRNKYLVIADDLTGSNDTGVQMTKRGIETKVLLFPTDEYLDSSVVLDTESRTIPKEDSFVKVQNMTRQILEANHFDIVYKKIDSTLRGNIAKEIKAVSEVYQPKRIIFAPAYPKINRTTVNGIHHLNGKPLMETELVNDPLTPIWTDNVQTLLQSEWPDDVSHYTIEEINSDLSLKETFIHTFDILTDDQLEILTNYLLKLPEKTLFVGSAGLAEKLFENLQPSLPTLSVVGSISEVSLKQMDYTENQGTSIVQIELNDLMKADTSKKYQDLIVENLKLGNDCVLTVTRSKKDYEDTIEVFARLGQNDRKKISSIVKKTLATIVKQVLAKTNISGLFLTGGDTAIEVIQILNGTGCLIVEEFEAGIVKSKLIGGEYDGLTLVTKAGAFGDEAALYTSIKKMKR